jgi:hypothetical protein
MLQAMSPEAKALLRERQKARSEPSSSVARVEAKIG